ncbi:MAG: hypothetical protein PV344_05140 [Anaplasma sp.]|nr:hypothetical protein [Anaplasma sp.]
MIFATAHIRIPSCSTSSPCHSVLRYCKRRNFRGLKFSRIGPKLKT